MVASVPASPRISDGQLLVPPAHEKISRRDAKRYGRSRLPHRHRHERFPLFTGAPARRKGNTPLGIERDLVEAIIGLPNDLFFNTGI